jgi:hypothetical protein
MHGKFSNFGMVTPLDVLILHKMENNHKAYKSHVIKF